MAASDHAAADAARREPTQTPSGSKRLIAARGALFDQIREHADYVGIEIEEGGFIVSTTDRLMGRKMFIKRRRGEFRVMRHAVTVIEQLLGKHSIAGTQLVDVGANVGTPTIPALLVHGFSSAVCCEPEESNYRLLRVNVALNDLEERVESRRVAVSNRVGRANLVVAEGSPSGSWIAVDDKRIREAEADRAGLASEDPGVEPQELAIAEVEVVTLDRLVETGTIDPDHVGLIWIDAQWHEGQVLQGASTLIEDGVAVVFEFDPAGLDARGNRDMVHEAAQRFYTHFVDLRRQKGTAAGRLRLRPVTELPGYAERFLDPSTPGSVTDLLLVRLNRTQIKWGATLPTLTEAEALARPET